MQSLRSLNHNINCEALIVYSGNNKCIGYYLNNGNSDTSFDISISDSERDNNQINSFIYLKTEDINKLEKGDIILFRPNGKLNLIYKSKSQDNTLFLTDQCNNHCLMCSQPPKVKDDIDYFLNLNTKLIDLLPKNLGKIGITGGEPTLLGEKLILLLQKIANKLPDTSVHLLSNGRRFKDINFAEQFSYAGVRDMLIGVPLHSDFYGDHDLIAQSYGAYYETLKGLYNLARFKQKIELRIVVNLINYKRLPQIADYIHRNLPFVSHIAFMALEYTGLVPKNNKKVWIDPLEYRNELEQAVLNSASWGMNVSVFNIPLCLLNKSLHQFARKSISDWKVNYFETCNFCTMKRECGGDFRTSLKHSQNIAAIV